MKKYTASTRIAPQTLTEGAAGQIIGGGQGIAGGFGRTTDGIIVGGGGLGLLDLPLVF